VIFLSLNSLVQTCLANVVGPCNYRLLNSISTQASIAALVTGKSSVLRLMLVLDIVSLNERRSGNLGGVVEKNVQSISI
jgi:hypothetical protein